MRSRVILSTHGGAPNYTYYVSFIVESMDIADQGVAVEQFEQAVRERVLDRGFRYLEGCPLQSMGTLASFRGDIETARDWFARSLAETEADRRITVNTRTMARAIQAELRMGDERDTARINGMVDRLAQRVAELGLDPGWGPLVDEVRTGG